jgi:DNA-binding MarR family transcriptional regulator
MLLYARVCEAMMPLSGWRPLPAVVVGTDGSERRDYMVLCVEGWSGPIDDARVTELAQLVQLSKPTVVYLVNDLERLGYVERVPDPDDGRAKLIRLTERGARAQEAAREIVAQIEHDWSLVLGRRDFATLRELLRRLHDALWPSSQANPS